MKFRSGKEVIGQYSGINLMIDWDELLYYQGEKINVDRNERTLGKTIFLIALVAVVFTSLADLSLGHIPVLGFVGNHTALSLVFWLGVLGMMYGSFLLRDKNKFDKNIYRTNLYKLTKYIAGGEHIDAIYVNNYLHKTVFEFIDYIYFRDHERFIYQFTHFIFTNALSLEVLSRLGLDESFREAVLKNPKYNITFESCYSNLLVNTFHVAMYLGSKNLDAVHFLLVLIDTLWKEEVATYGVTSDDIAAMRLWLANEQKKKRYLELWRKQAVLKPTGPVNRAYTSVYARNINKYGEDYTHAAAQGLFELIIGREEELGSLISSMRNLNGSAVLLLSKPGVGKTRLLRHLAVRMVVEDVPAEMKDKRLVAIDMNDTFTQLQSLEAFKSMLQSVFEEAVISKDIILVLDGLDAILNMRIENSAEIINQIISSVGKYHLQVIATATEDNYLRYVQTNSLLVNTFQVLNLAEPNPQVSQQIIIDELPSLERKYQIKVQLAGIKQLINLSYKISQDRAMPSKAIELLEEICIAAQSQNLHMIDATFVSTFISRKIGVNVGSVTMEESARLMNIEQDMSQRVIGQDAAISAIGAALRRARAGLGKSSKPIASFLFYGPTGVGKTEVAKTLAATYFGSEKSMVRLDMSEYQEESNLNRLIGMEENGQFSGGFLTEPIRSKPFSLILLDELEKANPKVLDLFLQILDDGFVTDGLGRKVDFTNTIIIATSNAASKQIAEQILQGKSYDEVFTSTLPELRNVYRVEFLNRFDKVIMFKPLLENEVRLIVRLALNKVVEKLKDKAITLQFSDALIVELANLAYNPIFGAREINRMLQENLENKIADFIISGKLTSGRIIKFDSLDNVSIA